MNTPKKKRDPVATRAKILSAAEELLITGDGAIEMAWVAKAAGVSQGLAYHHFGSKEGLLAALVDAFYDRVEAAVLMARLGEIEDWEERERARTERYIAFLCGAPLGLMIVTTLATTPAVAALESERWTRLVTEGARNIGEGQRRGAVGNKQDAELLAAMVLGATRAAATRALQAKKRINPASLADEIWQFLGPALQLNKTD